ncbi:MAG TPA: hypothetical protein VGE64_09265 [Xanthomonadaceae bacterium]
MNEVTTPATAGTNPPADPSPGILWPVGARLVSATRSMLWLAPLLGGLMLLVHFWRVGYLPALSFSELGVVLGAFGLFVAIGLVAALLLILFPVWMLFSWTSQSLLPVPPNSRRSVPVPKRRSLSRRALPLVAPEASAAKRRTFSMKVAPGGLGLFLVASMVAMGLAMTALLLIPPLLPSGWNGVGIITLFALGLVMPLAVEVWLQIGISPRALRRMRAWLPQFALLLVLYLFLWPAWMVLLVWFDAWPETRPAWIISAMFALVAVPWVHWMWYATMRGRGTIVLEVRVVTSIVILLYAGLATPLIDGAASTYGFGMMRKVDQVLSARGCAIVKEALPGQACEPLPAKGDDDSRVYRLHGVDVLTRIGASYVIAPAGGIDDRRLPRLALPAGEVHALVRRIETKQ